MARNGGGEEFETWEEFAAGALERVSPGGGDELLTVFATAAEAVAPGLWEALDVLWSWFVTIEVREEEEQ